MSAVRSAMFEWDAHLHYINETKGVAVLSPSRWSKFAHATLVVDVTEIDGTCKVKIHTFLPGAIARFPRTIEKYEREFAQKLEEAMPSR